MVSSSKEIIHVLLEIHRDLVGGRNLFVDIEREQNRRDSVEVLYGKILLVLLVEFAPRIDTNSQKCLPCSSAIDLHRNPVRQHKIKLTAVKLNVLRKKR